jgi:dienelactone hydrolase
LGNDKVMVVLIPTIFGVSRSFLGHMRKVNASYVACCVHPYDGQTCQRPDPLPSLGLGKNPLDLVEQFDDEVVMDSIARRITEAHSRGCEKVFLMGFGAGAEWALSFAEKRLDRNDEPVVNGVIGWYPRLIFPKESAKNPPTVADIKPPVPVVLFFGRKDIQLEPGTIELAQRVALANKPRIRVYTFDWAGHAFADAFVQGNFPSSGWFRKANRIAAGESWFFAMHHLRNWTTGE